MIQGSDFDNYTDHTSYFLKEDALQSVAYDLYFSPAYRYYCDAGCGVCYIDKQLKASKSLYHLNVPEKITQADTDYWYSVFDHFYTVRTNDDFHYLRLNFPHMYRWYQEHGKVFEFGMTDNSIVANHRILMNDIHLRGIADISLSEEFLNKTLPKGKILNILHDYFNKYDACQVKIIRTTDDYHHPESVDTIIEWLTKYNLNFTVHHDLRSDTNARFDLSDTFQDQNCYILSYKEKVYHIQKNTVNLFNDQFFYTFDGASDLRQAPFAKVQKTTFDARAFLADMCADKIVYYSKMIDDLSDNDFIVQKFKSYFEAVQQFHVNKDYNFIPEFMLSETSKYYFKLLESGFKKTPVGLYLPNGPAVPIIEYK